MRRKHKKLEDYYRLVIKPQMLGQTNLRSVMEWLDHGALPSPITVTPSASDFPRDSSHSLIKYHSHDWFYDQRYLFRGSQPCLTGNGNLPWNSVVVWCCHPWPSWSVLSTGLAPSTTCLPRDTRGPGQTFYPNPCLIVCRNHKKRILFHCPVEKYFSSFVFSNCFLIG